MGRSLPGRLGLPALVVAAAVALSSLVAVAPATADSLPTDPTSPRTPATVTADALPTPQVDGVVYSQIISGGTAYVAGRFTKARPAGSPAGGKDEVTRTYVLAYDLATGTLSSTFAPSVNGQVKGLAASPDGKRIYLAGSFTSVNGTAKYRLAAVDRTSGALVTSWNPGTNATVNSITAVGDTVYLGGIFTSIGKDTRPRAAAVSARTGAVLPWAPQVAGGDVLSVVTSPDGSKVALGGGFTTVNGSGQPGRGLAMLDPVTGANLPFRANDAVRNGGTGAAIYSLSATAAGVYGSGYDYFGDGNLEGAFQANWDGDLVWVEDCHGDTYSVAANTDAVYIAGHPHYCGNIGGQPQTDPWSFQHAMAFSQSATQTIGRDPYGYHNWEGTPAPSILTWVPEFGVGTVTGLNQAAWSVAANDEYVLYGGEFPTVNGKPQAGLARFAIRELAPNTTGPELSGALFVPDVASLAPGSVRVAWPANWDRDNGDLAYEVYRDGDLTKPVFTTTTTSTYWERPALGFVDEGLEPGSEHSYRVRATDPLGNTVIGDSAPVTVTTATALPYRDAVAANGATAFWRLGEASGSTVRDSFGLDDMVAQPGVVRGAVGQVAEDGASTFSGADDASSLAAAQVARKAPDTFSVGAWFRTTTTQGGKIVGYGDRTTGRSNNYDRHVYMDDQGRVTFGVWTGQASTITSPTALNDGQWHQVVASMGDDGMQMFVDGKRVGTTSTTRGQDYQGTWRIGGDTSWSGAPFFAGDIDDVAVYPTALTRAQVDAEWVASGRPSTLPTAPGDAYGAAVFADDPIAWFRLDGEGDRLAADSSPEAVDGLASGGVTAGATGALSGGVGRAATFDGQSGGVATGTRTASLDTYSVETWFRTTTTAGGKLIGFGGSQTGWSSNYDRSVYLEPDGRLQFGTWSGQLNLATSSATYNDGAWHHVVGTQGQDGMRLFVDGEVVGTNAANRSDPYTGHWRIGGDSSWSGSGYLAGDLDEAAVYDTQLSAATVGEHHRLGAAEPAPNVAPRAAFTSTVSDLTASLDASGSTDDDGDVVSTTWDLGDGTALEGVLVQHEYQEAGTYRVTATVTDDRGATGEVTQDVTVTAPPVNTAPSAAFTSTVADLTASFDASGSTDADGAVTASAWDFGDGTTGTGVTTEHAYGEAGTYAVTLTVTDDQGATATVVHEVTVTAPRVNTAPTAAFTATADQLGVAVDGTGSADPDGPVASWAWTFGDGGTATGPVATHDYAAAGSYTVTLTVTDAESATGTTTRDVVAVAPEPTGPQPLLADAFDRVVTGGWGSADTGGAWTRTGAANQYAVSGGAGQQRLGGAGWTTGMLLAGEKAADVDLRTSVSLDKVATGGGTYAYVTGRKVAANSEYRASLRFRPGGTAAIKLDALRGSATAVTIGADTLVPGAVGPGTKVDLRLQVTGTGTTTIRVKAWVHGTPEPERWTLTTTDSTAALQAPGSVGLGAYASGSSTNVPQVVSFDDLVVTAP